MEIARVLIVQRENRDRGAFAVTGIDHWVAHARICIANARKCQSRHRRSRRNTVLKGELQES